MSKNILIVDRMAPVPASLLGGLAEAGFYVRAHASYDCSSAAVSFDGRPPDLVILCCEEVAEEERAFVRNILTRDCLLIVLCAAFGWGGSRFILLANPYNLGDEFPGPDSLTELVEGTFLRMHHESTLRESHHLGSGLGLVKLYVSNIRQILSSSNIINTAIDEELDKVVRDVGSILSRSKGLQRRAAGQPEAMRAQKTLIPVADLLEQAKWALPVPPPDVKLTFELGGELAAVKVIVGQIIDILRNLVENAIEAMPDQRGTITVRAFNDPPHVQIEVEDTGTGIPTEHQPKIFNMFFSTKESSGFGLYDARKFARKNGGSLTFVSQLGQGSTFTLRLPAVAEGATYDTEFE